MRAFDYILLISFLSPRMCIIKYVKFVEECKKARDFIVIVVLKFDANNILIVAIYSNCINYLRNIKHDDRD